MKKLYYMGGKTRSESAPLDQARDTIELQSYYLDSLLVINLGCNCFERVTGAVSLLCSMGILTYILNYPLFLDTIYCVARNRAYI